MKTAKLISTDRERLITGDVLQLPCTVNYYYITTSNQCKEAVNEIITSVVKEDDIIAVDLETTGLDPYLHRILTLQIGLATNIQYIFDIRLLDVEDIKSIFNVNCWKAGHNIKFDAKFIKCNWNITLTKLYDTLLAEKIIRGGEYYGGGYSLDAVIEKRLGRELKIITADFKSDAQEKSSTAKKQMQRSFMQLGDDNQELSTSQLAYAAQDVAAETIFALVHWQLQELNVQKPNTVHDHDSVRYLTDENLVNDYSKMYPQNMSLWATALLEFKFLEVLVDLELAGIKFCKKTHSQVMSYIRKDYHEYRAEFLKIMGEDAKQKTLFGTASINPDSNLQVLRSLQEIGLKLENTGADTLENALIGLNKESKKYRVIKALIGYRKSSKLVQAFGDKLGQHVHPITKRIHYNVQQILETGRISTSNPNLQQIPARIDWKLTGDENQDKLTQDRPGFRECFVAEKGYKYLIYDYSAQELRVAASISMDALMLKAFREKKDLHSFSATLMYNENYDEFVAKLKAGDKDAKQKRQAAKLVSFGSLYGSGPSNLASKLHLSLDEAKEILNRFWTAYPDLAKAMPRYTKLANKLNYSNTVLGRRRYYNDLAQKIKWIELEQSPKTIDTKVRDMNMPWLVEDGPVTYDNIDAIKKKIIYRYRAEIGRKAGNHLIQGTSADMTKFLAILVSRDITANKLDAKIVGLIHDEIILEARDNIVDLCKTMIITRMKEAMVAFCPNVPAEVEGKVSQVWAK